MRGDIRTRVELANGVDPELTGDNRARASDSTRSSASQASLPLAWSLTKFQGGSTLPRINSSFESGKLVVAGPLSYRLRKGAAFSFRLCID